MDRGGTEGKSGEAGEGAPGRAAGTPAPVNSVPGNSVSGADDPPPDLAALARDWIELWQSELAALAADRETAEGWARLAALWAGLAASGIAALPRGVADEPHRGFAGFGFAGPAAAPRPAPAHPAPDAGGLASQRLLERVLDRLDAIERRLAEMEERAGGGAGGGGRDRPRRGGG